ncbi:MAG: hypothetical protein ACXWUN_01805, partial [Allosphingosinicella sp.]
LVESIDEAVAAVEAAASLPRAVVRSHFERSFTVGRMARDYQNLYERLVSQRPAFRFGTLMTAAE